MTFAPLKFSKIIERTIETIVYCFKNDGLLSPPPLIFFSRKPEKYGSEYFYDNRKTIHRESFNMWSVLTNLPQLICTPQLGYL